MNSRTVKSITQRWLTSKDRKEIFELTDIFLRDEPVTKNFNLTEEDKRAFIQAYTKLGLGTRGKALGFFDSTTNEMVGYACASLPGKTVSLSDYRMSGNQLSANLLKMIRFDDYMVSFAEEARKTEKFVHIDIGVAKPKYRGKKIAEQIIKCFSEYAEENNCSCVSTVTNNHYSYLQTQRTGFIPIKTIYYQDYRDPVTGEAVLTGIPPPHNQATLWIKRIENKSKL